MLIISLTAFGTIFFFYLINWVSIRMAGKKRFGLYCCQTLTRPVTGNSIKISSTVTNRNWTMMHFALSSIGYCLQYYWITVRGERGRYNVITVGPLTAVATVVGMMDLHCRYWIKIERSRRPTATAAIDIYPVDRSNNRIAVCQ